MRTYHRVVAGALLTGQIAAVSAQDQAETAAFGLEEVVVTAQKREESLQDVPIAISALSATALEQAGVQDMFDVAAQVPSLSVQQNTNPMNAQFRLRGVGNLGNIPNFEPAVAYFIDGAFRARSGLALGDLSDLDRIEILKGPQSTLYGKNSTAGVVAVYTREPGDTLEFNSELRAGTMQAASDATLWQAKASVSGPISQTLRAGLSGSYSDQGPVLDNAFTGEGIEEASRYSVRGQLVAEPIDALKLRLIASHGELLDSKGGGEPDFYYGNAPRALNAAFGVPCPDDDPTNRIVCRNFGGEVSLESSEATLIATYEFAGGTTLTSLSSWDDYEMTKVLDADQLNISVADFNDRQAGDSLQQELRLASATGGALDWLVGAFYYEANFERGNFPGKDTFVLGAQAPLVPLAPGLPVGQPGQAGSLLSTNDTEYVGTFAQTTWHAGDRFALTAGARWQTESKDTNVSRTVNHTTPSIITIALLPATTNADLSRETDAVTWSVSPQVFFTPDTMGYLTASHGFKSGGFNGDWGSATPAQREFDDEEVDHYEAGLKTRFADDRLQINAAAFYSDFTNYQEAGFVALQFLVTNAEKVTVQGAEVDLLAQLTPSLTAEVNAIWSQAEFDTFTGGSCYPGRPIDNPALGSCDLSGEPLTNAPELKTHAALQYEGKLSFGSLYARTDWTWSDEYHTNSNHDPRQIQDAYSTVDARIGVRFGSWDLSLWSENLLDQTYVYQSGVSNLFPNDPAYQTFLAPGRSYGMAVKFSL